MADKNGKKTGGREKGVPNKVTKDVKATFLEVFIELQKDKKANLSSWAKENATDFYKLSSKLIPAAIEAKVEGSLEITPITGMKIK